MDSAPGDATEFTVRAVAERLGIPTATLRSWNQRYDLAPRGHQVGRHRLYTQSDIAIAQRMVDLIRSGATPASAAQQARSDGAQTGAVTDLAAVLTAAVALDGAALAMLLESHLHAAGVIDTWEKLCMPAFETIVAMQDAGEGCIDVEHLLSWAVAGSLHRYRPVPRTPERVLLACTNGERHTLALEALRVALDERGFGARMLGASVPDSALAEALRRAPVGVVVLWSQRPQTGRAAAIRAATLDGVTVLLGGPGWTAIELSDAVHPVHGLKHAVDETCALLAADTPLAQPGSAL